MAIIKANPLFVDSTKFQGDVVPCRIEVSDVTIAPDEQFYVRITDRRGDEEDLLLLPEAELFVVRLRIRHQETLAYQFFVRRGDQIVSGSKPAKFRGTYLLSEKWLPLSGAEKAIHLTAIRGPREAERPFAARNNYDGSLLSSLINKWGF